MSLLGGALAGQKQYNVAEPLLVEGFEGMRQRASKIPRDAQSRLGAAADRLAALYEARGNTAEAAKWRKERQALEAPASPARSGKN
jgi:eukaryotic-like serine/threonine-protein kinase